MDTSYTVDRAKIDLDAALAAIRTVYEEVLGTSGWRTLNEQSTIECTQDGTAQYWAGNRGIGTAVEPSRWPALWDRIVAAASLYGFTAPSNDPAKGGNHFVRLANAHGDRITVATTQGSGSAFGGETVCHPGFARTPSTR